MLRGSVFVSAWKKVTSVFSFFLPPFLKLLSLNSFLIIATRKKKQMIFQRHNPGLCLRILNDKDVLDESLPPLRKNISMARKNTMTKRRITERHWISRLGLISDRLLQLFLLTFPPPFLFSKQKNIKYQLRIVEQDSTQENLESQEWFNIKKNQHSKNFSLKKKNDLSDKCGARYLLKRQIPG